MQPEIFIPQPIPDTAVDALRRLGSVEVFPHVDRAITRDELLESVPGKSVLVALGGIPYDRAVLEAAGDLGLIASMQNRLSTFVDVAYATERGAVVTGTPTTVAPTPVAELAMALVLGLACRLLEADRYVRDGRWRQNQTMALVTTGIAGKRLGVLGLGAIGTAVARRARAFDMHVAYHKRSRIDAERERDLEVEWASLEALFAESDFLVLAAPLTDETRGLVDAERLASMRPTAFLVNIARGAIVVEDDLVEALRDGVIAGAGLDVHTHEPPDEGTGPHPALRTMPNVLLTPHLGAATLESRLGKAAAVVDNVAAFLRGERPPHVLNPEVYERPARATGEVIG